MHPVRAPFNPLVMFICPARSHFGANSATWQQHDTKTERNRGGQETKATGLFANYRPRFCSPAPFGASARRPRRPAAACMQAGRDCVTRQLSDYAPQARRPTGWLGRWLKSGEVSGQAAKWRARRGRRGRFRPCARSRFSVSSFGRRRRRRGRSAVAAASELHELDRRRAPQIGRHEACGGNKQTNEAANGDACNWQFIEICFGATAEASKSAAAPRVGAGGPASGGEKISLARKFSVSLCLEPAHSTCRSFRALAPRFSPLICARPSAQPDGWFCRDGRLIWRQSVRLAPRLAARLRAPICATQPTGGGLALIATRPNATGLRARPQLCEPSKSPPARLLSAGKSSRPKFPFRWPSCAPRFMAK